MFFLIAYYIILNGEIMKKITLKVLSFITLFITILSGCKKETIETRPYSKTIYDVYNTYVTLSVYNENKLNEVFSSFEKRAKELHNEMDRDNLDSELSKVNSIYGTGQTTNVSTNLIEVLSLSLEMFELTEGFFNPALGSLIDIWEDRFHYFEYSGENLPINKDPSQESIENSLKCVPSYLELKNILILNENTNEVTFNSLERCNNKVVLSLGAIGKGFAMDKLKELYLSKTKSIPAMIDGGSSSLLTIGKNPIQRKDKNGKYNYYWNIGITAPYPYQYENLVIYQGIGDLSVSTSGNTVQYFYLVDEDNNYVYDDNNDPIKRTHILNPFTGYSEAFYDNITIISNNAPAAVLDALTTALYNVRDKEDVKRIINKVKNKYNIDMDFCFSKTKKIENNYGIEVLINQNMENKSYDWLENIISNKIVID